MLRAVREHCQQIFSRLPAGRLLALDVFRGVTITAMILVNNPGSWQHIYAPMAHASWHGWTLTDLIFPFFIFIVGVSITLARSKQLITRQGRGQIVRAALIRSTKLCLLGWFLALFYYNLFVPDYNWLEQKLFALRYMGVLQRIALVYICCVLLWLYLSLRQLCITAVVILLLYWVLMSFVPYYDATGTRYVGLLEHGNNLSAWLDNLLLGSKHLYYQGAQPFAFDPEGLLSTLPAITTGVSGMQVGHYLHMAKPGTGLTVKLRMLVLAGVLGVGLGELWGLWFPINKALWTSSYVLLSSGYACLVLAALLYLVEIKHYKLWSAPFVVFGANSIAFFMFAGVVGRIFIMLPVGEQSLKTWLYREIFQPIWGDLNGSLAYAICFLLLSYAVMLLMYRKGIFWKV